MLRETSATTIGQVHLLIQSLRQNLGSADRIIVSIAIFSQRTVYKALIGSVILFLGFAGELVLGASAEDRRPWENVLETLEARLDLILADMERVHYVLSARALDGHPSLRERLSPESPRSLPWGYAMLPEVAASPEARPVTVRRQAYSLEDLARWVERTLERTEGLVAATAQGDAPLEPLVARFERLRSDLRIHQKNISYHRLWQRSVLEDAAFFAERNRILERVVEWQLLESSGEESERRQSLRHEISRRVASFHPTPGLVLEKTPDGSWVLPVEVTTDIEDARFLEAFRSAVSDAFTASEASRSRRFSVKLGVIHIPAERLYPEGPPRRGEHIDERQHLSRFPRGALVLTTGAKSTHARTGRYIQLGPQPVSGRTLAHEFAHLLGFDDGYLRAYEGSPDGPYGVVLVEWTGLLDDIMGAPGYGRVSEEMIDRLVESYGEPATAETGR